MRNKHKRFVNITLLAASLVVIADYFLTPSLTQKLAVVDIQTTTSGRNPGRRLLRVQAEDGARNVEVPDSLLSATDPGDTLEVEMTLLFNQWRNVRVIRGGSLVYSGSGMTSQSLLLPFLLLFPALALYSFRRKSTRS